VVPGTRMFWAHAFQQGNEFGGQKEFAPPPALDLDFPADTKAGALPRTNTTLAVVAVDAALSSAEATRLAMMAQDGLARAVRPVPTPYDGDVVFALSAGTLALAEPRPFTLARLGSIAADCVARAIARGVYEAKGVDGVPGYQDGA